MSAIVAIGAVAFSTAMIGLQKDDAFPPLPFQRISLLRENGCWMVFEGTVPVENGQAKISLAANAVDNSLFVEALDEGQSIRSTNIQGSQRQTPQGSVRLEIEFEKPVKSAKIRASLHNAETTWLPKYRLMLEKDGPKLVLSAIVTSKIETTKDVAVEFASASNARQKLQLPWHDNESYSIKNFPLKPGITSVNLFTESVKWEEWTEVVLGRMIQYESNQTSTNTATVLMRITNPTLKTWPAGDLIVVEDGRLRSTVAMPFVAPNATVQIPLGRSLTVEVDREERELDRKVSIARRENDPPDVVFAAGSAMVANRSSKPANIRVLKDLAGEATAVGENGKAVRKPNVVGRDSPITQLRWEFLLPAGEVKRLTFGSKLEFGTDNQKDSGP